MEEQDFIVEMVEEQLVKGSLRWLANFSDVQRDYTLGNMHFPIYASGGLQERGFFLSRIYSTLVTPKYKIHFLLYTAPEVDSKTLRSIILACKGKFEPDDWIFLAVVQKQPLGKGVKETVTSTQDKTVGITISSLESRESVSSDNVLGKGLAKNLKLTEPKFEAFDPVNFLKSFVIIFFLSTSLLVILALSGLRDAVQPITILFMAVFSIIVGYSVYKTRYHTILTLDMKGFKIKEGNKTKEGKWSDYQDVAIHIASNREAYLRLHSKDNNFDLPLSRAGISRKEAFSLVKRLVRKE